MFSKNSKIEIDRELFKNQRLPLVYKDAEWMKLFGDSKNKDIIRYRDELIELEKKEEELERLLKKLNKDKQKYLKMILKVSDSVNNEQNKEDIRLLDEYKLRLLNVNENIDEVIFELETLPDKKKELNIELIIETINVGYEELADKEEELEKSLIELEEVNKRLRELIQIKLINQEWIDETYTFMHRLLGNDLIDRIDSKLQR